MTSLRPERNSSVGVKRHLVVPWVHYTGDTELCWVIKGYKVTPLPLTYGFSGGHWCCVKDLSVKLKMHVKKWVLDSWWCKKRQCRCAFLWGRLCLFKLSISVVFRCAAFMSFCLTRCTNADTLTPVSAKPPGTLQQHHSGLINVSVCSLWCYFYKCGPLRILSLFLIFDSLSPCQTSTLVHWSTTMSCSSKAGGK